MLSIDSSCRYLPEVPSSQPSIVLGALGSGVSILSLDFISSEEAIHGESCQ